VDIFLLIFLLLGLIFNYWFDWSLFFWSC